MSTTDVQGALSKLVTDFDTGLAALQEGFDANMQAVEAALNAIPPPPPPAGASPALYSRCNYRNAITPGAHSYPIVALGYSTSDASHPATALVDQLHQATPDAKVLAYVAFDVLTPGDTGVNTLKCPSPFDPNNPPYPKPWFVHHADGTIGSVNVGYGTRIPMNPANLDYQAAFANFVQSHMQIGHFDGVFIDDLACSRRFQGAGWSQYFNLPANPELISDVAWADAMLDMLKEIRAVNPSAFLCGNIAGGEWSPPVVFQSYMAVLDCAMLESWCIGSDGRPVGQAQWRSALGLAEWCEHNGKWLMLNGCDAGNDALGAYALASMLLVADGHCTYVTDRGLFGNPSTEPWSQFFDDAVALGAPSGDYNEKLNGICERPFENGRVRVNATIGNVVDDDGTTLPAHTGIFK